MTGIDHAPTVIDLYPVPLPDGRVVQAEPNDALRLALQTAVIRGLEVFRQLEPEELLLATVGCLVVWAMQDDPEPPPRRQRRGR